MISTWCDTCSCSMQVVLLTICQSFVEMTLHDAPVSILALSPLPLMSSIKFHSLLVEGSFTENMILFILTLLHDTVHTDIAVFDCEHRRFDCLMEIVTTFRVVVFFHTYCSLCHTPDISMVHLYSHSTCNTWSSACAHA